MTLCNYNKTAISFWLQPGCVIAAALIFLLTACLKENPVVQKPEPVRPISASFDSLLDARLAAAKDTAEKGGADAGIALLTEILKTAAGSFGELHPKVAELEHQLGNLHNNYRQDWAQAQVHFKKAVALRKQLPGVEAELAKSYFALARVQRLSGSLEAALQNIHECMTLREAEQPQDSARLGRTYYEAGVLCRETGDLNNSLRYLQQAVHYYLNKPEENAASLANTWNETAATCDRLGKPGQAAEFYEKALDAYRELGDSAQESGCLNNLAGAKLLQREYDAARIALRQALDLNGGLLKKEPANADLLLARSAALDNLGILFKRTGQLEAALEAAQNSLELAKTACGSNFHPAVAGGFDNLGNVLLAKGQTRKALEAYRQGIASIVPEFRDTGIFANPVLSQMTVSEKPLLLTLLKDKTEALRHLATQSPDSMACLLAAANTFSTLDTLLILTRQSCREDGSKYFLAEKAGPLYEEALELNFSLLEKTGDARFSEAMLALCERNKAGVLLESLNDLKAKRLSAAGNEAIEKEQALRQTIARQELAIYHARQKGENETAARMRDSLFLSKREMEKLTRHFEEKYPAYFQQKFQMAQALPLPSLQTTLPPGQVLVEYFLGDSSLFIFCLSNRSANVFKEKLPSNFYEKAAAFRRSVSDWEFIQKQTKEAEASYLDAAAFLFDFLLKKPLESLKSEQVQSLVIVPDGVLGYLPFEALLTEKTASWKARNTPFLLKKYAVSYLYSSHFLTPNGKRLQTKNPAYPFAGFGLEYDEKTLQAIGQDSTLTGNATRSLPDWLRGAPGKLPYSSQEARNAAKLWGGRCWLDGDATLDAFLKNASEGAILHFAGHGFTDETQPLNSSLVFTKTDSQPDFLLRAANLYGMELKAELAVLSACNTGNGGLQKGEGIMSFARAFSYAGVPSLVMSLWSITDASTANIMQAFYSHLQAGLPKDEALRLAKLGYLEKTSPGHALPVYWAGAILSGQTAPVSKAEKRAWPVWLLVLATCAGLGFWANNWWKPKLV